MGPLHKRFSHNWSTADKKSQKISASDLLLCCRWNILLFKFTISSIWKSSIIHYWWSYKGDRTVDWERLNQGTINFGRLVKNTWNILIEMELSQLFRSNQQKAYSDKTPSWYRLWILQLQRILFNNFIGYSRTWLWMYLCRYW